MRRITVVPVIAFSIMLFGVGDGLEGSVWGPEGAPPVPVAPGSPARSSEVEPCPTFHWGLEDRVETVELVVYLLPEAGEESDETDGARLVSHRLLPGSARGWTPALGDCFAPGRYGWLLRARSGEEAGPWSEAARFEVPTVPSQAQLAQALAVLERFLAAGGSPEALRGDAPGGAPEAAVPPADRRARTSPEPTVPRAAPQALALPDVTAFRAVPSQTEGVVFGVHGVTQSHGDGSAGVVGQSTAASGLVAGVYGQAASAAGAAGVFDNTAGGAILRGLNDGVERFAVAGDGHVTASSFAGDGSQLTNLPAGTAGDLDCLGCVDTGDLADGSVSSAEIAVGAVGSSQIADGSVATADLAFDPATQAELDAEAAARAAGDGALQTALDTHKTSGDHDGRYVNVSGDAMTGALDLGGHALTEVTSISRTGATNDLTLSSQRDLVLEATSREIRLNASISGVHLNASDAVTTAVTDVLTVEHATTEAAGSGIGAGVLLQAENVAGATTDAGRVAAVLTDAGGGTEASELRFFTRAGGGALTQAATLDGAGTLTATSFAGDGSQLTNLPAGTADDVNCVGCVDSVDIADGSVGTTDLAFDPATQAELDAEVASRTSADTGIQTALDTHKTSGDHDGRYVLEAGDTMVGDLNLPNLIATGGITAASGSLSGSSGEDTGILTVTQTGTGFAFPGSAIRALGPRIGVEGVSPSVGVKGEATATGPGPTTGVLGTSVSTDNNAAGVRGQGSTQGVLGIGASTGVRGQGTNFGVRGWASSGNGTGVEGVAEPGTDGGRGVEGHAFGPNGTGIWARSLSSGVTVGVDAEVASSSGTALKLRNTAAGRLVTGLDSTNTERFTLDTSGNVGASGTVTAGAFVGDGSGLTGLSGAQLDAANTLTAQNTFTLQPSGAAVGQGPIYVNPASVTSGGDTLLGLAVGGTQRLRVTADGDVNARAGLFGGLVSVALEGQGSSSGVTFGVKGNTSSTSGTGMRADATATTGQTFGVHGVNSSEDGIAVFGFNNSAAGTPGPFGIGPIGVKGGVTSAAGVAGVFDNSGGGAILSGRVNGAEKLHVAGDGTVTATAFVGDGSQLTNLPAGTADDLDCIGCVDTGNLADAAVTGAKIANAAVGSAQIADGSVPEAKLAFDPATQAELDAEAAARAAADGALADGLAAHATSGDHDDRYVQLAASSPRFQRQVFTADGTWVRPTGVDLVWVTTIGGGGQGGASGSITVGAGGGGAGQAYVRYPLSVSGDVGVTVGQGGSGCTAGVGDGADGSASSFGSLVAAGGKGGAGNGGIGGDGGGGGFCSGGAPGDSGAPDGVSGGTLSDGVGSCAAGGGGGFGTSGTGGRGGGMAGGSGGSPSFNNAGGGGGGGVLSFGVGGVGGDWAVAHCNCCTCSGFGIGADGTGYGAGGGGSMKQNCNACRACGSGGVVIVEWFE